MRRTRLLEIAAAAAVAAACWAVFGGALLAESPAQSPAGTALASVRLYNPTGWERPSRVEVPIGRLATPGQIDWKRVRLIADDGREVPFAIREGKPHWRARLAAPIDAPRAEDLLVLGCAVPPKCWVRFSVEPGVRREPSALVDDPARWVIAYPGFRVAIDRTTAMLVALEAAGESLLVAPLSVSFQKTAAGSDAKSPLGPPRARLVAQSSGAAMTELHFQLEATDRFRMALTYRVHAAGLIEIELDERPWEGASPWLNCSAAVALGLSGTPEALPHLLNRAPYYGFKDYAAAVKHAAAVYRRSKAVVVELGEETTNGRRWNRRLWIAPAVDSGRVKDLVKLADEGLVVDVRPCAMRLPGGAATVAFPEGTEVPAQRIVDALAAAGVAAQRQSSASPPGKAAVTLQLAKPGEAAGIEGDGFEIRPQADSRGVVVTACTRFGLMQAAARVAEHLRRATGPESAELPLVAGNPAVAIRGAGFGGGDFEVDFPYGTEAEWQRALEALVDSGMNCMTDLGMWSNWKMPVSYRDMPELRSKAADAYDEVSGAKLAEFAEHRDRALRLIDFLHRRGVKVWLWLPTGCVPTTYAEKHPEAMAPKNERCPCFTHPLYSRYLESFLKEMLETYPIDGIVMIRDDNGGLCPCERCKAYVAKSPTRSAAWEQYLILYRWLKARGFRGEIAVYPYFDGYEPRLDALLPSDLLIVGHGSGAGTLLRSYETLAPMGDTWIDNLFAGFRLATTARMKRLLSDRNSYWLGGAMRGSELPWRAIGRFGWEPTATVNTLRYEWAIGWCGRDGALAMVDLLDAYESLWELYDLPLLPEQWVKLDSQRRRDVASFGRRELQRFRQQITAVLGSPAATSGDSPTAKTPPAVAAGAVPAERDAWFSQMRLFATYFEYHLRRMELISQSHALAVANKPILAGRGGLAEADRRLLVDMNREIFDTADRLDREMASVPGNTLARTRAGQLTRPFSEFVNGYDSLEWHLDVKQFAGAIAAAPGEMRAGAPWVLRVQLQNRGIAAWTPQTGPLLQVRGDAARVGLPPQWNFDGPWMVFGDHREIELRGTLPGTPGEAKIELMLVAPFRHKQPFEQRELLLRWK